MIRGSRQIGFLACVSLAALQLSGLHMHVDEGGYVGVPEGPHIHGHYGSHLDVPASHGHGHAGIAPRGDTHDHDDEDPADHDYGDATDVSLLELSGGAAKLVLALILLTLFVPLLTRTGRSRFVHHSARPPHGRRSRWRPPLRAPPLPT